MFNPQDELEIRKRLMEITSNVKLVLFTQSLNCETCPEAESLMRWLVDLSDKLTLEVYNLYVDREKAQQYKINRVPTLVVEGDRDYGIRYVGLPGGYEFAALLEDIVAVGRRQSGLSEESREKIQALMEPLNIKVFTTPT